MMFRECTIKSCRAVLLIPFLLLAFSTTPSASENGDLIFPWYKKEAPPPEPIPPVYKKLKELHITTVLVKNGKPNAAIVVSASGEYAEQANRIQQAIRKVSGVTVPILNDDNPNMTVPISGNIIALGNRSTNNLIDELYNRHYTLLDLSYPGSGGYALRTLHNPFGNGYNVVFIGGSDHDGVVRAT
ncbi:MAG: hypothetical protein HOC71_13190, partial [Candidatus Latescibacteria bacterium]|nr:hypothetical protein [Candidatus Latescibacterota bacterium]